MRGSFEGNMSYGRREQRNRDRVSGKTSEE